MVPLNSEHFTGPAPPGCAASGDPPFPAPPAERGVPGPGQRLRQARPCPAGGRAVPASPKAPGDYPGARPGALRPVKTAFPWPTCLACQQSLPCGAGCLGALLESRFCHMSARADKVGRAASTHVPSVRRLPALSRASRALAVPARGGVGHHVRSVGPTPGAPHRPRLRAPLLSRLSGRPGVADCASPDENLNQNK